MFDWKRIHIETENEYYGNFNASHDSMFIQREYHAPMILKRRATQLIDKWNKEGEYIYILLNDFGCN